MVSSPDDLAVPATYCVLDGAGGIAGRVKLLGVDGQAGYGVDHRTGERVVLRPLDAYIESDRLAPECT